MLSSIEFVVKYDALKQVKFMILSPLLDVQSANINMALTYAYWASRRLVAVSIGRELRLTLMLPQLEKTTKI
jgi:hypothetical protein